MTAFSITTIYCLENVYYENNFESPQQSYFHYDNYLLSRVRLLEIPWTVELTRLLCPWNFPGKNTGGVAISFSRGSSQPRDQTQVSSIVGRRFTIWATREALWKQMCRPQISNFEGDLYKVTLFKALFWLQVFPNYL